MVTPVPSTRRFASRSGFRLPAQTPAKRLNFGLSCHSSYRLLPFAQMRNYLVGCVFLVGRDRRSLPQNNLPFPIALQERSAVAETVVRLARRVLHKTKREYRRVTVLAHEDIFRVVSH